MKKFIFLISLTLSIQSVDAQNQSASSIQSFFNPRLSPAKRLEAISSTQVLTDKEAIHKAVDILKEKNEPKEVRVAALQRVVAELPNNKTLADFSLRAIPDHNEPKEVRMAILEAVQANFFGAPGKTFRQEEYTEAMRKNLSDPEEGIRTMSIRILCSLKDTHTIDRLLEGLQNKEVALLSEVDAIHLLSFQADARSQAVVHMVMTRSNDKKVKLEAIRMLKQYEAAESNFTAYLQDNKEDLEVRRMAAASLHHRNNPLFAQQIKAVIFNPKEDLGLRTFCLNALVHHNVEGLDNNYISKLKSLANDHQQPKLKANARKILEHLGIQW